MAAATSLRVTAVGTLTVSVVTDDVAATVCGLLTPGDVGQL